MGWLTGFFGDVFADVLFLFCCPFMFLASVFLLGAGRLCLVF